jgi:hypothetical protein
VKPESIAARERRAMEVIAAEYEKQGYEVSREPSVADTPDLLRPFQPDMLARKGDEMWIIEVKTPGHKRSDSLPAHLAEKAMQAGWRFRFVIVDGPEEDLRSYTMPDAAEIEAGLETSAKLAGAAQGAAALLFTWSLFEAAARRRLLRDQQDPGRAVTPVGLAKVLVHLGHLDDSELGRLREIANLRNQVAHGLFQAKVSPDAIDLLSTLTRRLLADDRAA